MALPVPPPETIAFKGGPASVAWRRSARARRVSLRIDAAGGGVIVTLPARASRRSGLSLLLSHEAWVTARLAALPPAVMFADGAMVPIGGEAFCISHRPLERFAARLVDDRLEVSGGVEFLARRVRDFLRAEARRRLSVLASAKAVRAGVTPRRIGVKDTSSRWGSCAADRSLAFSWRLLLAPDWVQDYVAAHEVAHLRHMNHGPQFWRLVEELTPHRRAAAAWLLAHGPALLRIG